EEGAGSGADPAWVRVLVDGLDRTSEFVLAAVSAPASLLVADGSHSVAVQVIDRAGNRGAAVGAFTVDTRPPAVSTVPPAEGSYLNRLDEAGRAVFSRRVEDLDPGLTLECRAGGTAVSGTVQAGEFKGAVPLRAAPHTVELTFADRRDQQTVPTSTG